MASRRQFLKLGLVGGALFAGAGWWAAPRPEPVARAVAGTQWLNETDGVVVAAIAPTLLGLADVPVAVVVQGVDRAVLALPAATRREVRQLLDLLGNGWGRRWLAGVRAPWAQADGSEISAFLHRWQTSRLSLLRSGYQGLHALIMAAWYGNPQSWPALGYAQPAQVMELLP
jgi:hypothetical protein